MAKNQNYGLKYADGSTNNDAQKKDIIMHVGGEKVTFSANKKSGFVFKGKVK